MKHQGETPKMIKACAVLVVLATPFVAGSAFAMGSSDTWSSEGTDLSAVTELVDNGMYEMAIDKIEAMLEEDSENADLYNYLAYSQRKSGDFDSAAQNYERALMINPEHLGALEYQGELFLKTSNPQMAAENLARIEQLCGTECAEYKQLASQMGN
ncbi:tetratricopeptide repeat protein [Thalassospira sp.]|uniref:tetratricopeptide repeat protein n=1 Tax=Thalassospira sp. TaxID=1912094 RepID=UPI003AA984B0